MRLHTLRMHAVGPFADEQVIDFDRLGAGGLFLFEGPDRRRQVDDPRCPHVRALRRPGQ